MQFLAILVLSVVAAVTYGIVHDQVTARICLEYFTIGHPPIFETTSPTLLGLGWGIVATWWVGLGLGLPLAVAARLGRLPKRDASSLVRPIVALLAVMAACALTAGVLGYLLGHAHLVVLVEPMASRVSPEKHARFLADLWAHICSYATGFVGGMVVIRGVWKSRGHRGSMHPDASKRLASVLEASSR